MRAATAVGVDQLPQLPLKMIITFSSIFVLLYFLYQSSIGFPMPGTGRGRYEPLSRLNLVERLLLLELLLLLLLLLVKTPLV